MNIQLKPDEISALLRRQMQMSDRPVDVAEFGTVLSVGDGIARVDVRVLRVLFIVVLAYTAWEMFTKALS